MQRYFRIVEPIDESMEPIEKVVSEQEILVTYWKYWKGRMEEYAKKHTPRAEITRDNCIEDWCIIHWANEIE